jgi:hypothetical protein
MNIFVYRNGSDKVEQHHNVELIPELLHDESVIFWVDFEAPTEDDDHVLLDIQVSSITVEDCRRIVTIQK